MAGDGVALQCDGICTRIEIEFASPVDFDDIKQVRADCHICCNGQAGRRDDRADFQIQTEQPGQSKTGRAIDHELRGFGVEADLQAHIHVDDAHQGHLAIHLNEHALLDCFGRAVGKNKFLSLSRRVHLKCKGRIKADADAISKAWSRRR